jgi:AbrB family looped-hinge helix DNA binding protein
METVELTSKGQITIPAEILRKLDLQEGNKVSFIEYDGNFLMVNASENKFRLSGEQISAALKKGWSLRNISSWGSIDDPTFVEQPDIPPEYDTPIEEFD